MPAVIFREPGHVDVQGEGKADISRATAEDVATAVIRSHRVSSANFVEQPSFVTNYGAKNVFYFGLTYLDPDNLEFSLIAACKGKGYQPLVKVVCAVESHPHLFITSVFDSTSGKHACELTIESHNTFSASPLVVTAEISSIKSSSKSISSPVLAKTTVSVAPAFQADHLVAALSSVEGSSILIRLFQVVDILQMSIELDGAVLPPKASQGERLTFSTDTLYISLDLEPNLEASITIKRSKTSSREHTLVALNKQTNQRHAITIAVSDGNDNNFYPKQGWFKQKLFDLNHYFYLFFGFFFFFKLHLLRI